MGTRGPAPSKAELRLLKGNQRDRDVAGRKVAAQPRVVPGVPQPPETLGDIGRQKWFDVAPELARMGVFGNPDATILEAWCRTYELWLDHDGGRGYSTLTMTLANLGSKLGLDPASRLRMTLPEAPDDEEDRVFGTGR